MFNSQMAIDKSVCIPVFSNKLAGVLMAKGFVLQDFKPNKKQPERKVYFFVDSLPLQEEIKNYTASKSRKNLV